MAAPEPAHPEPATALSGPDLTYIHDVDLGDGQRMAQVSSTPVNYRTATGEWAPIDPRFKIAPGGFVNTTNNLRIMTGENQSTLMLENGSQQMSWQPQSVVWQPTSAAESLLAHPLETGQAKAATLSADSRTVQYSGLWNLDGLSEEIVSGPGQVEQSLVFARSPLPQTAAGGMLTLRA